MLVINDQKEQFILSVQEKSMPKIPRYKVITTDISLDCGDSIGLAETYHMIQQGAPNSSRSEVIINQDVGKLCNVSLSNQTRVTDLVGS